MNDCASLIPTYASDTSGVCSALYELGGLTIVHDASGCNSTYSTFDEPRWYEEESLIVISGLTEMDAIFGHDERLIENAVSAARDLSPLFITLLSSPMPYLIGTDLSALAETIEQKTQIPTIFVKTNGMRSYLSGLHGAYSALIKRFVTKKFPLTKELSVNLLGATPLDLGLGEITQIKAWLAQEEITVNATLAMGSSLEELTTLSQAHVNLVLTQGALGCAKLLHTLFGTPYVCGKPYGQMSKYLARQIRISAKTKRNSPLTRTMAPDLPAHATKEERSLVIVGEGIASLSLAYALSLEHLCPIHQAHIYSPLEFGEEVLGAEDRFGEEDEHLAKKLMTEASHVVADPLYRLLVPKHPSFHPLPHVAFSGRIYWENYPQLINTSLAPWFLGDRHA